MCRTALLIASFFFLTSPSVAQETRFVDETGVDAGDCTDAENPCATIGFAIDQAESGNIIDIAAGAYTESVTLDKDLMLQGEGQESTIIQAHEFRRQATERTITVEGEDLQIEITGVTIRHGVATDEPSHDRGGGIFVNGSTLNLSNTTLTDNEAVFGGGVYNENGPLTLTDVTFHTNEADSLGGGLFTVNCSSTLTGVHFVENRTRSRDFFVGGAGMADERGSPVLTDVTFELNVSSAMGGGMFIRTLSEPVLTNVTFHKNSAMIGGGMADEGIFVTQSIPTLENVVFSENVAESGGGMYIGNTLLSVGQIGPRLTNILFIGNIASISSGGGLRIEDSESTFTNVTFSRNSAVVCGALDDRWFQNNERALFVNTIFWGNEAIGNGNEICAGGEIELRHGLYSDGPGDVFIDESHGNFIVENSLTEDPLFADAENGDLRLTEGSPAIDAGDPDTDLALFPTNDEGDPIDLDGEPRVFGEAIDIGAFEHQGTVDEETFPGAQEDALSVPSPNPAWGSVSLTLQVAESQHVYVEVFDVTGRRVQTLYEGALSAGTSETLILDASALPAGVYVIWATGEDFTTTRRVTVVQ